MKLDFLHNLLRKPSTTLDFPINLFFFFLFFCLVSSSIQAQTPEGVGPVGPTIGTDLSIEKTENSQVPDLPYKPQVEVKKEDPLPPIHSVPPTKADPIIIQEDPITLSSKSPHFEGMPDPDFF